jgi:hypothetical protein
MASNENDGRTFLDDLFDKAEEVMDGVEKIARGDQGVLPATYADGSKIVVDSIAGENERMGGEPNWLVLRFYNRDGNNYTRRYLRDASKRGDVVDIGEKK